jgi:hypothetical protein
MKISQQIVGVNQRLGNNALPNMQRTTRAIFDSLDHTGAATDFTLTYFQGVSARVYPAANVSSNKFEVGESLAIQGFAFFQRSTATIQTRAFSLQPAITTAILNFYIGNQRVVKDLEIGGYSRFQIGESISEAVQPTVFRLETPIVIPPQIEFYATIRVGAYSTQDAETFTLCAFGTGTLLNPKSNY